MRSPSFVALRLLLNAQVAYPFFVSFLLVFLVVILPLHLAVVLDAYAHHHAARCERNRRKVRLRVS